MVRNINSERGAKDLGHEIAKHYEYHGANLKIKYWGITPNNANVIYLIETKKGVKHQLFFDLAKDVQMALKIPYFQPIQEGTRLYLAVSDREIAEDSLMETLQYSMPDIRGMKAPYAVGYDVFGEIFVVDIYDLPHLIIGGTTNSGKSMALRSLIVSAAYNCSPQEVIFFLFDTVSHSLTDFNGLPHLACDVIEDKERAIRIILWLNNHFHRLKADGKADAEILPMFVCVFDDLPSFIRGISDNKQAKRVMAAITNLLQHGRHGNIHVIIATQDPTKASTGIDWGCIESRMSFKYPQYQQSVAILGMSGAEKLSGKGSMLFIPPGCSEPVQLQGSYIDSDEVEDVVAVLSARYNGTRKFTLDERELPDLYDNAGMTFVGQAPDSQTQDNKELCRIILWTLERDSVAAMNIKQTFSMGNRANNILEQLTRLGIVDDKDANKPRKVLPQSIDDLSNKTMNLLINNGVSMAEIEDAVREKLGRNRIDSYIADNSENSTEDMEHQFRRAKEIESYINNYRFFKNQEDLWFDVHFMATGASQKNAQGKSIKTPPTPSERWGAYEYIFAAEAFADDGINSGRSGKIELPLDVTNEEAVRCMAYAINLYEANPRFSPPDIVLELFPYLKKYPEWHEEYFVQRWRKASDDQW
ncbi:hypothetical protein LJC63_00940 [Ruminococcaceae bacterium OttesenSCG-928-L11]|nr:hypothetical protein [Ruminococcaceae bacterium OttesenSCG-928-L11]